MTVMQDLSHEVALKGLAEDGVPISPAILAALLSTLLYSRRSSPFFVEPIIAGLDHRGKPYLCGQVKTFLSGKQSQHECFSTSMKKARHAQR